MQYESGLKQEHHEKIITILLADDHPLLRQALRDVLEKERDFKIIAEANDGEQAVQIATQMLPDVVIMDIGMPKLNGLEATRQIKSKCPNVAVLVLTVHDDSEHILGVLEAGAAGYLTKSVFSEEVIQAVRGIAAGENVLSPAILQQIVRHAFQHIVKPKSLPFGEKITSRELQILRLAAIGWSNKDMAENLELSLSSVKSHLAEIFTKLNVSSRTEAVIASLRSGILNLSDLE